MKRDLIFFLAGLVFGAAIGYFLVSALSPESGSATPATAASAAGGLGLEPSDPSKELDAQRVQSLEAAAKGSPEDARPRAELGRVFMESGDYDKAIQWLQQALALDGENPDVRNQLALSLLSVGKTDEAVSAFEAALDIDPANPQTLLGLGRLKLYVLRDIEGGLSLWERLLREAPDSEEARGVRDELEALRSAHDGA